MSSHDRGRAENLRAFFASYVVAADWAPHLGISHQKSPLPRVEMAFARVPRERFAGPGPWWIWTGAAYVRTPDDDPAFLYQDTLIALDRLRGVNIGQPSLHARCLGALAVCEGESVVQVGAGSGYYTALLAELAGPSGLVTSFEIDSGLAERATANLADRPTVTVLARSGTADRVPCADVIYVNAGATRPASVWLDALRPNGRLLFPLTPERGAGMGAMLLVTRAAAASIFPACFVCPAQFISCDGARDPATAARLARAFANGGWQQVRSLRIDSLPDGTCWFAGDGWWLSTALP